MYTDQNITTNSDQFIDPYNDYNKLITLIDIKNMFKKFDIDVNPQNINFYINALTHKSYIKKEYYDIHINQMMVNMKFKPKNTLELLDTSNERLEFLGDTVIKCVVSGYLFSRYQYEDEGFMTRLKTKIEDRKSLAIFAKKLGLDEYMIISKQIEDNNGRNSEKLLEDCFESFVGALYLDVGFEVCRQFMYIILETEIEYSELLYKDTNYKDQLLRFYHQNKWSYPQYVKLNDESNDNNGTKLLFTMGVKDHNNNIIAKAKATTKREAEQLASMYALYYFKIINEDQMVCTIDMQ
jgi:dsRNA-specific ribonuclease